MTDTAEMGGPAGAGRVFQETARSAVSMARCRDYAADQVGPAVDKALAALEPLGLSRGARVLLKPNCLSSSKGPDKHVNTRAEVVAAVGRYLADRHGLRLVIADSGGMGSYGRAIESYRLMGLDRVAAEIGAELVSLETTGLTELVSPVGRVLGRFQATELLNRVEAVVNLPKLKTHMLTGMTGAIKNCLGLLPGSLKRSVHSTAPSRPAMSEALVDIFAAVRERPGIALNLMDGVVAMEGSGPAQGRPKPVGWIMAAKDAVALDFSAAVIMGFDPSRVEMVTAAAESDLGWAERDRIDLIGAEWSELPVAGYKRPFSGFQILLDNLLPTSVAGRAWDWATEARPRPIKGRCEKCGLCVEACPAGALELDDEGVSLDKTHCIECYCCLEHCPAEGFRVPRGFWDRVRPGG